MARRTTDAASVTLISSWRHLHAFYKPPALSSEPDRRGETSLLHEAARLLGAPPEELHVATRLDAVVSGVVVVAAGKDGTRRVAELQRNGHLERRYAALTDGVPAAPRGTWDAPVGVGPGGKPVVFGKDARPSCTRYVVAGAYSRERSAGSTSLLVLTPETGRTHQLRVHASHAGLPLLGDIAHGGPRRVIRSDGGAVSLDRVFLHAFRIRVVLDGAERWRAVAAFPADYIQAFSALGGPPDALDPARLDTLADSPAG